MNFKFKKEKTFVFVGQALTVRGHAPAAPERGEVVTDGNEKKRMVKKGREHPAPPPRRVRAAAGARPVKKKRTRIITLGG